MTTRREADPPGAAASSAAAPRAAASPACASPASASRASAPPASAPPASALRAAAPAADLNALYVVATLVPRRETIVVGAFGSVTFARGWQAYVGSARRGRAARVARHRRADKPLRWHADYLFTRHPATRAWLLDTPLSECELAALLRTGVAGAAAPGGPEANGPPAASGGPASGGRSAPSGATATDDPAPRFGASDCGCAGHLVGASRLGALRAALGAAAAHGGTLRALPVERRKRD